MFTGMILYFGDKEHIKKANPLKKLDIIFLVEKLNMKEIVRTGKFMEILFHTTEMEKLALKVNLIWEDT